MRLAILTALLLALAAPAGAQTPAPGPSPAPSAAASSAPCEARSAGLGGIGRASVVAFRGPVFGDAVCATVANLAADVYAAQVGAAPADAPLAVATLGPAGGATLAVTPGGALTTSGSGPYLIAPGGSLGDVAGTEAAPRVAVAFAGARVLVVATTAVTLADLARTLRDQPDLFGVDAVERAVVIASGPGAALALRTDDGVWGTAPGPGVPVLALAKR